MEQQLSNLADLKNDAVENLTKDNDVKELAMSKLEQQLKNDGTIKEKLINKALDEITDDEFREIQNEQKALLKVEFQEKFQDDEELQLEAKKQAKKKLLEENLNKMNFTNQDTINYYKQLDSYSNELERTIGKLSLKNSILKKVLKFVSTFLPNAIQEKVNNWIGTNDMQEVEEQEITDDIIQYIETSEQEDIEESEVL